MTDVEKLVPMPQSKYGQAIQMNGEYIEYTAEQVRQYAIEVAQAVARRCAEIAEMYELGESSAHYIREEFGIKEEP